MQRYGCIGEKLTHSFSREIHGKLADYSYELIQLKPDELASFMEKKDFAAINVTIPYKQLVMKYLDSISEIALRIGAVNTIINDHGHLHGDNTDYDGMKDLIKQGGIQLKDKKVLILGSGGTSRTAQVVSSDLGARQIWVVSRSKAEAHLSYEEAIINHSDAQIIINTTPVGMYPNVGQCPIDIDVFPKLEGVVDVIYNPLRSRLVLAAKAKKIPAVGGLFMLVRQAVVAVEKFLNMHFEPSLTNQVFHQMCSEKENIVLIGMPGSGKSTVGRSLALDGYTLIDTDEEVEKRCGCSIKELVKQKSETYFRELEAEVIREISLGNSLIISTGGGAILREENVTALKQNGCLFFIDADLSRLTPTDQRPLADTIDKLIKLYHERIDLYKEVADVILEDQESPNELARHLLSKRMEIDR